MASIEQMKNPLLVGKAIRAQLEHEIPQDLPLEKDFKEGTDFTITDQYVSSLMNNIADLPSSAVLMDSIQLSARTPEHFNCTHHL